MCLLQIGSKGMLVQAYYQSIGPALTMPIWDIRIVDLLQRGTQSPLL